MSKYYDEHLKSEYWKTVSGAVKARAGYRCQLCNSQHDLAAHHRTYEHRGRELDYLDDLVCLCRRCHAIFHGHAPAHTLTPPTIQQEARPYAKSLKLRKPSAKSIPQDPIEIEAMMPPIPGPEITLTKELIDQARTNGAFTNASLRAFGLRYVPETGWPDRLVGKSIPKEDYRKALEGRFQCNTGKLPSAHRIPKEQRTI